MFSHIWETLNLTTDADSITIVMIFFFKIFFSFSGGEGVQNIFFCGKNPTFLLAVKKNFGGGQTKYIYQGSFDHVKVGPTTVLALHNLLRQIHMLLDILEFRVENNKNYLAKTF